MNISEVINTLINEFGEAPKQINNGNCGSFANRVCDLVPGAVRVDEQPGHCFVRIGDRYYDAEAPQGVGDWKQLPFFVRNGHE